ncbi:MAG: ATP synthase F1 subunit gamma [Phycisphaerales bacterium]|nr:ATP synthase F1 subunit gamma [Planctomycetota bacterium]MCH8509959.1 ATP synthase F1 subunit gamma [Phycisphaerales bacterium]
MGKSREIKKRMKAVGNIKRITRTMQMIATSKFSKAQQASVASKPYTEALFGLVGQLGAAGVGEGHPLLSTPEGDAPELTLIITADRGLCGPYNGTIVRAALNHLRGDAKASGGPIEVIGKKGANTLKFNGYTGFTHHSHIGDKPRYEDIERMAQSFIDAFTEGRVSAVRVIYMKYFSAGRQRPEVLQLLPFSAPVKETGEGEGATGRTEIYEFSPDAGELLDAILPAAVKAVLFQAFNDAVVSEHIARMVAMKAATDNAGKMGNSLRRQFNRARQAQITTELTEIISGAAALE